MVLYASIYIQSLTVLGKCFQPYNTIQETSNGGHGGGYYLTGRFLLHTVMRCLRVREFPH